MNSFVISSICAFISALVICIVAFLKGHKSTIRNAFIPIAFLAGFWCLFPAAASISSSSTTTLFLIRIVYISALFTGPAFLTFGITMAEAEKEKFERKLIFLSYIIGASFLPLLFSPLFIRDVLKYKPYFALVVGPVYPIFIAFFAGACLYSFYRLAIAFKTAIGQRKNQIKYIFIAYFFAFLSAVVHFGSAYGLKESFPHDILVIVCMAILAYAVITYRLMDIRIAIANTIILIITYSIIFSIPAILVTGFKQQLIWVAGGKWWLIPIAIYTIMITLAPFVYQKVQRRAEGQILRDQRHNHTSLMAASQTITLMRDFHKLLNMIVRVLTKTLSIKYASIYLRDRDMSQYTFCVTRGGRKDCIAVDSGNSLVKYLQGVRKPVILEELKREYSDRRDIFIKEIVETMNRLDADILVPSFIENTLIGFLVLGNKRSGEMYTTEDLNILSNLANQSALAIENAQFLKEREEMQAKLRKTTTLAAMGELLGIVDHEFRNKLGLISSPVQGMVMGIYKNKPESEKRAADTIAENMRAMEAMLHYLQEYRTKSQTNVVTFYNLADCIQRAFDHSKDKIKEWKIIANAALVPSVMIKGIGTFPDIFKHLVINSVYSMETQGGPISVKAIELENEKIIEITHEDMGVDISGEIKDKELDGGGYFTDRGKLGGLNLVLAQKIVSDHKGTFEIQSNGGHGTKFVIRLPIDFTKIAQ